MGKAGQCASDAGGAVAKTKKLIEVESFEIKFRLATKCENKERQLNMDQMKHLVKEFDDRACKALGTTNNQSEDGSVEKVGT